jgi:hypothetical protein
VIAIAAAVVVLVQRSEREPAPAAGASPSATESAPASNLDNDMHDGSVTRGDAWLAANLPAVLASRWFADDGTVIVTMDENDASPSGSCCAGAHGGRVPMVVISVRARARGAIVTPGDH